MDDQNTNHSSDEILQQGYDVRDKAWKEIGTLDSFVLAHIINPGLTGMPQWPDLRQSYKVVHLANGHTIIATDGLSDPFMKDHPFYKPDKNGFGVELFIEITEPFDMGKAGQTWWYNLLYQSALQVAYSGDFFEKLNEHGGTLSTELYDVPGLPDNFINEGRAPVLLGMPSNSAPLIVKGPLSLIRFVSIELLTLDELQHILDKGKDGRSDIARGLMKQSGGPVSSLERRSVLLTSELKKPEPIKQTAYGHVDFDYDDFRNLQDNDIQHLSSMLGVDIDYEAVAAQRAKYPDEPIIFVELAMDEYSPQLAKLLVGDDHKWDDLYIFNQLKEAAPELQLVYATESGASFGNDEWKFNFTALGSQHTITTEPLDIFPIFNYMNDLLAAFSKKFMYIDDFGDGLDFLLVDQALDEKTLRDIIYTASPSAEPATKPVTELNNAPPDSTPPPAPNAVTGVKRSIDLYVKQSWLEKSSETALEEFKSVLSATLNSFAEDRHIDSDRWTITKVTEGDVAHLLYDERSVATLGIESSGLHIVSQSSSLERYDDIMYAIRYAADRLVLAVFSNTHGGARLPQDYRLSLDQTYFERDKALANFFAKSKYIPRFAPEGIEYVDEGRQALVIYSPYYAENKDDGSIHILNNAMLTFLSEKDNQETNREFSYRVASSMQDFARKHDLGLIPSSFYQNYGLSTKIINQTYFDVGHINRKVFIDPYVWDFDDEHDYRFYKNVKNGMHLMDKVRKGENLDTALKRVLREELQVADNYVGARVWGIEFDRDRDDILTPRLKINIFVNGMTEKHKSQSHDWVSIK
jgi:hypothetical protein